MVSLLSSRRGRGHAVRTLRNSRTHKVKPKGGGRGGAGGGSLSITSRAYLGVQNKPPKDGLQRRSVGFMCYMHYVLCIAHTARRGGLGLACFCFIFFVVAVAGIVLFHHVYEGQPSLGLFFFVTPRVAFVYGLCRYTLRSIQISSDIWRKLLYVPR